MGKLSKKGFTLVEIIVSLAIFSAVLAMLAGVLVSGFKYFYTTSETDSNKRVTDELMEYIRDELVYATDVVISDTAPNGQWRVFSVKDGKLKHGELINGEIKYFGVFQEKSFYNYNTFQLTTRTYENNRLDIQCSLSDENEQVYTTRETLELLNVSADKYDLLPPITNVGENGIKIYYKKDIRTVNNGGDITPPELESGYETVGSLPKYITSANNRGLFFSRSDRKYYLGDMVYYNGSWWRRTSLIIDDYSAPSITGAGGWQLTEAEYIKGNEYLPGDVVKYTQSDGTELFLQAKIKPEFYVIKKWQTESEPQYDMVNEPDTGKLWIASKNRMDLEKNNYEIPFRNPYVNNTILSKLSQKFSDFNYADPNPSQIQEWNPNESYQIGDFVKIKAPEDITRDVSRYYYYKYLKVINTNLNTKPGENSSGWQLLELDFDENSSYVKGDVVNAIMVESGIPQDTHYKYWCAKQDILKNIISRDQLGELNTYWDVIDKISQ